MGFLEFVGRVIDLLTFLWDIIVSWRLVLCMVVAVGAVFVARQVGAAASGGVMVIAALIGFGAGVGWELLAAAARRGYV